MTSAGQKLFARCYNQSKAVARPETKLNNLAIPELAKWRFKPGKSDARANAVHITPSSTKHQQIYLPPPAIVALIRESSSSSPRMASCKWRGVIRFTFKSFEALPANSSTLEHKKKQLENEFALLEGTKIKHELTFPLPNYNNYGNIELSNECWAFHISYETLFSALQCPEEISFVISNMAGNV